MTVGVVLGEAKVEGGVVEEGEGVNLAAVEVCEGVTPMDAVARCTVAVGVGLKENKTEGVVVYEGVLVDDWESRGEDESDEEPMAREPEGETMLVREEVEEGERVIWGGPVTVITDVRELVLEGVGVDVSVVEEEDDDMGEEEIVGSIELVDEADTV